MTYHLWLDNIVQVGPGTLIRLKYLRYLDESYAHAWLRYELNPVHYEHSILANSIVFIIAKKKLGTFFALSVLTSDSRIGWISYMDDTQYTNVAGWILHFKCE